MKSVIVTGASGGIGSAVALEFAKKDYGVLVHYNTGLAAAKTLADKIVAGGGKAAVFGADLKSFNEASELCRAANNEFGSVDVLVNNAGISQQKLLCDITDDDYDEMMSVNLKSCFNMCKAALAYMISQKSGSIVNISSMWGISGGSCEAHYSAAKAGMIGLTKALAKEAGPSNISVNCVAPGVIATKMNEHLTEEDIKSLEYQTPLCRIGKPVDVAAAVAFLAEAEFITGQVLAVDGGITV